MCIPGGMIEPWLTYKKDEIKETPEDRVCSYSGLLTVDQYQKIAEREERIQEEFRYGCANR